MVRSEIPQTAAASVNVVHPCPFFLIFTGAPPREYTSHRVKREVIFAARSGRLWTAADIFGATDVEGDRCPHVKRLRSFRFLFVEGRYVEKDPLSRLNSPIDAELFAFHRVYATKELDPLTLGWRT
jgi:hypothetical protein